MDKKKLISLIIFVIGLTALASGVIFLVINLNQGPSLADGEYLVSVDEWILDGGVETNCAIVNSMDIVMDEGDTEDGGGDKNAEETNCIPSVFWNFTEIGKGTLTTNNHVNDYDFIWALEDGKLLIETDWLYKLEDEYEYALDQNNGTLTLTKGDETIVFRAIFEVE